MFFLGTCNLIKGLESIYGGYRLAAVNIHGPFMKVGCTGKLRLGLQFKFSAIGILGTKTCQVNY